MLEKNRSKTGGLIKVAHIFKLPQISEARRFSFSNGEFHLENSKIFSPQRRLFTNKPAYKIKVSLALRGLLGLVMATLIVRPTDGIVVQHTSLGKALGLLGETARLAQKKVAVHSLSPSDKGCQTTS